MRGLQWTNNHPGQASARFEPGAISRNIDGDPDDYGSSPVNRRFYDEGEPIEMHSLAFGYSAGVVSVGLGVSWGGNQSLGGYVSIGVGSKIAV